MKNKILLTLFIISLFVFGFAISANAETEGYYTYTVSNGEATITDVDTSISGDIVIPDTLGGYPVTSIGKNAFYYCDSLTSVTIPDSVTSIDGYAFQNCKSIKSIKIPDSVTSIGNRAFSNCTSLTDVYYNGTEEDWNNISIGTNNTYLTDATIHFEEEEEKLPASWGSAFKYLDGDRNEKTDYKGKRVIMFGKNPDSVEWGIGKYGVKLGKYYYPARVSVEANGLFAIVIVDTDNSDEAFKYDTYSIWTGDSDKGESFLTEIKKNLTAVIDEIK